MYRAVDRERSSAAPREEEEEEEVVVVVVAKEDQNNGLSGSFPSKKDELKASPSTAASPTKCIYDLNALRLSLARQFSSWPFAFQSNDEWYGLAIWRRLPRSPST